MRRLSLAAWPVRKACSKSTHSRPSRRRNQRRLQSEPLEDRRLLAVLTVSNLDDTGAGSLRNALIDANGNGQDDIIDFSVSGTINIMSQLPTITDDVIIDGGNAITLDASVGTGYRIFNIDAPTGAITTTLNGLTLSGASNGLEGGAIFFSGADDTLNLNRVTVSDNVGGPGGGLAVRGGAVNIRESTFRGNSGGDGGAMSLHNGNFLIENSTFSGNLSAGNGSSIDHVATGGNSSLLDIKGSTIVTGDLIGNNVNTFVEASSTAETRFQNSIFAAASPVQNVTGGGPGTLALLSLGHNLASDSPASFTAPGDQTNTDPLLGPLANNGGPTQTHALLPGSPALNMGDPSLTGFDQRGAPFLRNAGGGADIGAFERQTVAGLNLVVDTTADENDGDYTAGDLSLREAIGLANGNVGTDTITFSTLFNTPQTIAITSQLPTIGDAVNIAGTGANLITINAGGGLDGIIGNGDGFRVFYIFDDTFGNALLDVEISGLTITGGDIGGSGTDGFGGAIFNRENLTLTNSTLSGNAAAYGGGLWNSNYGRATITNSMLSHNLADEGGAIWNDSHLNVIRSSLTFNGAYDGGGIWTGKASYFGSTTVSDSTLSVNGANLGGGIFNRGGTLSVNRSVFSENSAFSSGGGIYNGNFTSYGLATITDSTLTNNTASSSGGGIRNAGVLTVNSSTISGNSAVGGGGIAGSATVTSSILANSTGGDFIGYLSGSHNLIEDGSGGLSDTIIADPLLGPLADNGGPTQTLALLSGSPALDMGDPSLTGFDQRGAPFLRNAGGGADIGAFERQTVAGLNLVVDTTADENDGDYTAGDLSLREAIGLANGNVGTDTITFSTLFNTPQTIAITSQLPTIGDAVNIAGTGANLITINAGGGLDGMIGNGDGFRILEIDDGSATSQIHVEISGVTLTGGDQIGANVGGGAILNREDLTLSSSRLVSNASTQFGGAIDNSTNSGNSASLMVVDSEISENVAGWGGGISNGDSGTTTILDSVLSGNTGSFIGGGAIYSFGGMLLVTDSELLDNVGGLRGGGIFVRRGEAHITDSIISGNSAGNGGGGISNYGTMIITNSTISDNSAVDDGGGIFNGFGLTVNNSTISGNSAGDDGGGISNSGSVIFTRSTVSGNMAGGYGGGIFSSNGLSILDSTIAGNSADFGGGVYAISLSSITNSTISANSAVFGGGGLFFNADLSGNMATVTNSTVSGNSANTGGGIYNYDGLTIIQNSTITQNHADFNGSGVRSYGNSNTRTEVRSSIIAGNFSDTDVYFGAGSTNSFLSNGFNLVGGGNGTPNFQATGDQLNSLPMLAPLANNGGPTFTHALLAGSPALNVGFSTDPYDQRGTPFLRNDGNGVDIGAFESQTLSLVVDTTSDVSDGNFGLNELSLREAIELANANPNPETITFSSLFNTAQTIVIASQLPTIRNDLTITGTDANLLTIDANNNSRIFYVDDGDVGRVSTVEISGLTLTRGRASQSGGAIFNAEHLTVSNSVISGNRATDFGGGIFNDSAGTLNFMNSFLSDNDCLFYSGGGIYSRGTAFIRNVDIYNNQAGSMGGFGGGISNGGTMDIIDSNFSGNQSPFSGGAIENHGVMNVTDSLIENNSAERGGGLSNRYGGGDEVLHINNSIISGNTAYATSGGGIINYNAAMYITDSTISDNTADIVGGGVDVRFGEVHITDSIISGNSAMLGGGINNFSTMIITNSTISDNSAGGYGGGIHNDGTITTLSQSTISGNSAAMAGGGIANFRTAAVTDSTIWGNSAGGDGGGIFNWGMATVTNSTISGNSAGGAGGGLNLGGSSGMAAVSNSTIFGNSAVSGGGIINDSFSTMNNTIVAGSVSGGDIVGGLLGAFNLIQDGSGVGLTNTVIGDPLLGLLANNGGPTLTHALLAGSPAIDAGDPTFSPPPDFDQRGAPFVRFFDDPSAPGGGIDIGAFELQTTPSVDPDFNNDGFINGVDIDLLQANIVTGPADPGTFDLTGDGLVTVADRNEWLVQAGAANLPTGNAYLLADANLDGVVDGQDFIVWNANKFTTSSAWTRGDFNVDGVVDGQDFILWNANKFQSADAIRGNAANLPSTVARRHDRIIDQLFVRRNEDDDAPKRSRGGDPTMSAIDALFAAYA